MTASSSRGTRRAGRLQETEARWFVQNDDVAAPTGPALCRTDSYHVGSLTLDRSWKRRGGRGTLECKVLVGAESIEMDGVCGVRESWLKFRCKAFKIPGLWVSVDKQLWRRDGLEICRLSLGEERWWSVATTASIVDAAGHPGFARWAAVLRESGTSASYPRWLLDRVPVQSAPEEPAPAVPVREATPAGLASA